MSAVLAISVSELEQFDISRISFQSCHKELRIVINVYGIHTKAEFFIHILEYDPTAVYEVNHSDIFWCDTSVKTLDPVRVILFSHSIKTRLDNVGRLADSCS